MPRTTSFPVLTTALRTANERLASLPRSSQTLALKHVVDAIEHEVAQWSALPPAREEHEGTVKKVFAIHLAIAQMRPRKR